MAKTDEGVMKMVESELAKNPKASVEDLFEKAKGMLGSIGRMTRRQFHARYPLQVKRRKGAGRRKKGRKGGRKAAAPKATRGRGRGRGRAQATGDGRDAMRQVFLKFAQDLAGADKPKDLVKVVLSVDRYVEDALKATGR